MRFLEVADDFEVDALDLRQVDLLDVHETQQLAHRLGHFASAFIARSAALRHADLRPELLLVQAEATADFARVEHSIEEFHGLVVLFVNGQNDMRNPMAAAPQIHWHNC